MDIKNILQDEKKKKYLIIGLIAFFVIVSIIFIFTRSQTSAPQGNQTPGQTQLLNDLSQLAPRGDIAQNPQNLVAPIITVSSDIPAVAPGQAAIISWNSTNATSCADGNGNALRLNGSISITPQTNYTLDVVCTNPKGTTIQSVTVAVTTSPIITISASPSTIKSGEQSIISWSTLNTSRCVDGTGATLRLSGSVTVTPQRSYTFDISCVGPNGSAKKSVTVTTISPATTGVTDQYVYIFKWKATADPNAPFQTSTFQTNSGCQSAQSASTGFEKSACIRVAVGTTTTDVATAQVGTGASGASDTTGGSTSGASDTTGGSTSGASDTTGGSTSGAGTINAKIGCVTPLTQSLSSGATDATANGEVTILQNFLNQNGFLTSSATGNFGSETELAVKMFQASVSLATSGVVDADTRYAIQKANCISAGFPAPAGGSGGSGSGTVVSTNPTGPQISLTLNPTVVGYGQTATLSWNITGATTCTITNNHMVSVLNQGAWINLGSKDGGITQYMPPIPMSSSYQIKISGVDNNVTFLVSCTGDGITNSATNVLNWDSSSAVISGPPTITSLAANPTTIAQASIGATSDVTWSADNATSCTALADAYAELWTANGYQQIYSDHAPISVEISGTIRIKPGFSGSSVPYHTTTTSCATGSRYCHPTTTATGNGSRLLNNPPETVTLSCKGPIKPYVITKSVTVTITPTPPPSGGGGGW